MLLAALLLAETLSKPAPDSDHLTPSSVVTQRAYASYIECYAKEASDRLQKAGSPEARMMDAKAACRAKYDAALAAIINDADEKDDRALVATHARDRLDEADTRILEMLVPPPPSQLAQLPIRGMVGDWRLGGGALAVRMTVHYTDKPSIVGTLESSDTTITTLNASGLSSWEIIQNEHGSAVFQATFADGRATKYARIPSSAGEMDFINASDTLVQRYDILLDDGDLLIRWVEKDMSGQLRFHRQMRSSSEAAAKIENHAICLLNFPYGSNCPYPL